MKKILLLFITILTTLSLTACKNQSVEEIEINESEERDSRLIESVYGSVENVELSNPEQTEKVKNLMVDIDKDGINELLKLTYEYMENHLHVYTLDDDRVIELDSDDYVAYITSLYDTDDGIYVAAIDGDGLCYENASLLKLSIVNGKLVTKEILNATCDQEIEDRKREEINNRLLANEITEDEAFDESVAAHTLKYSVDGIETSKEEFYKKVQELNSINVRRKIAYLTDLIEGLWNK